MKNDSARNFVSLAVLMISQFGCGGSDSVSSVSTTPYPLQTAYANVNSQSRQQSINVAGSVNSNGVVTPITGSLEFTEDASSGGNSINQVLTTISVTLNGVEPIPTMFFEADFSAQNQLLDYQNLPFGPLAFTCQTATYEGLPTTITIGQSGLIATLNCYEQSINPVTPIVATQTAAYAITAGASSDTATLELFTQTVAVPGATIPTNIRTTISQTNFQMDLSGNVALSSFAYTAYDSNGQVLISYLSQ